MHDMLPCQKNKNLFINVNFGENLMCQICVFMIVTCGRSTNILNYRHTFSLVGM